MSEAFLSLLNLSITASIVVVCVLLLRLCMRKAPKWISVALWAFVGARLMVPFAIESKLSIIPSTDIFSVQSTASAETFKVHTGVSAINSAVNEHIAVTNGSGMIIDIFDVLSVLWFAGTAALMLYGLFSCIMLYFRVSTAIPLKDNIYQSENVKSPFVLGFIKPRIYIPFNLDSSTLEHVLSHEQAHIKRGDHIIKPLAYILLCFHWFNPFIWLAYILLCRDIEQACDEKVIKDLTFAERKKYALALLQCKVRNTTVAVCPVAFGELSVSSRIKRTLSYKKPALWVVVVAVAVSIISAGCLLTNPKAESYSPEDKPSVEVVIPVETTAVSNSNEHIETSTAVLTTPVETTATQAMAANPTTEALPTTEISFTQYYEAEPAATEAETVAPTTAVPVEPTETTVNSDENQEYFYYEYDDSSGQEYVELEIPTINSY